MQPESKYRAVWPIVVVGTGFVAAVLVALLTRSSDRLVGALLVLVGLGALAFAPLLSSAQRALSGRPFIPAYWNNVRPLTFRLWGAGVLLCGLAALFLG
jgi:hypothetical protein